jgi:ectoine hydroxylase-related dioxygenase (phytanoyl-CoA dioxygenase family)
VGETSGALQQGVLKPFTLNANLTRSILEISQPWITKVIQSLPRTSTVTGQRNLISPSDCDFIDKSETRALKKLVQEATDEIALEVDGFMGAKSCAVQLVLAPAKSSKSNGWTNGPIHRDTEMWSFCGVLTATMVLGDVNQQNGSIRFWKKSTEVPFKTNGKHNNRIISKLGEPEDLVAKKGSVMVWDSRMLHQSLANQSDQMSVKINWFIVSEAFRRQYKQLTVHL